MMKYPLRRGLLAALALVLLLPAAHAQNGERLTEALDLTEAQVALVEDAIGDEAERGDLWSLSAALAPTLTAEQKEKLFAGERGDRMRPRRGEGRRPGEGRDKRPRGDRPDAETGERHEARTEAMQQALGLTDEQVQQLDALHAERKAEREERRSERQEQRADRGELHDEVAAILTPEQQEIAKVHRALAARLMHGARHRGHRR